MSLFGLSWWLRHDRVRARSLRRVCPNPVYLRPVFRPGWVLVLWLEASELWHQRPSQLRAED